MKATLIALALAFGLVGFAEAQNTGNMFSTPEACLANLGKVDAYEPQFLGNASKNPVNGTTKIAAPLEGAACVHMFTMRGWQWVPQTSGTVLRWDVHPDGSRIAYARDICGNAVDRVVYPSPITAPTTVHTLNVTGIPDSVNHNVRVEGKFKHEVGGTLTLEIPGCTDPKANNYNPLANRSNGSCVAAASTQHRTEGEGGGFWRSKKSLAVYAVAACLIGYGVGDGKVCGLGGGGDDDHTLRGNTLPKTSPADKPIRTTGAIGFGVSF